MHVPLMKEILSMASGSGREAPRQVQSGDASQLAPAGKVSSPRVYSQ